MAITRVQIYEELKRKRKLKEFIEPNVTITKLTDTLEENDKIEYSIDTPDDIHLEGFDNVTIKKEKFPVDIMRSDDKKIQESIETININKKTNVGNNDAGKTYAGIVKSLVNDEGGNGVCILTGDFIKNTELPNVLSFGSGSPEAVNASIEKVVDELNEEREAAAKVLDTLPAVFGAPSGGFFGTLLRVVGTVGAVGQFADAASPLGRLAGRARNFGNSVLNATGINGVIDQVETAFEQAETFVNDGIETVIGGAETALDNVTTELTNATSDFAGQFDVSDINSGSALANTVTTSTGVNFDANLLSDGQVFNGFTNNVIGENGLIVTSRNFTQSGGSMFGAFLRDMSEDITSVGVSFLQSFVEDTLHLDTVRQYLAQLESADQRIRDAAIAGIASQTGEVKNILSNNPAFDFNRVLRNLNSLRDTISDINIDPNLSAADKAILTEKLTKLAEELEDKNLVRPNNIELYSSTSPVEEREPVVYEPFTFIKDNEELRIELGQMFESGFRPINALILHSAETKISQGDLGAKFLGEMHNEHTKTKDGIQYHYVIRTDGNLERGKKISEVGQHTNIESVDNSSISLVLMGGIDENEEKQDNFTTAQLKKLDSFIRTLLQISPNSNLEVLSHNDFDDDEDEGLFDVEKYMNNKFGQILKSREKKEGKEDSSLSESTPHNNEFIFYPQFINGTTSVGLEPGMIDKLDSLCDALKINLEITSAYRNEQKNSEIPNAAKGSMHVQGKAVDISIGYHEKNSDGKMTGKKMDNKIKTSLILAAHEIGFRGFGIYPRHIHIDTRGNDASWGEFGYNADLTGEENKWAREVLTALGYRVPK